MDNIFLEEAPELLDDFTLLGDSLEGIDKTEGSIYTAMPMNKWGNINSSSYFSTYVVYVNFMGRRLAWHKWAAIPLMRVQAKLIAEGWDTKYYWTTLQTYNKRYISGTHIWSNHSWPTAIDINPSKNPYTHGKLITDIPPRVREIFKAEGFKWGGDYKSVKDAMHFEFLGEPVKDYTIRRTLSLKDHYMKGNDVTEAQELLAYFGYNLDIDGSFGTQTDAMVRSFQASKLLSSDGIIGNITWSALLAKRPDRVLKKGMSGDDVNWVQRVIVKIKAARIDVDGDFGNQTLIAVKGFQRQNNLEIDGIVGTNTWKMLRYKSN